MQELSRAGVLQNLLFGSFIYSVLHFAASPSIPGNDPGEHLYANEYVASSSPQNFPFPMKTTLKLVTDQGLDQRPIQPGKHL